MFFFFVDNVEINSSPFVARRDVASGNDVEKLRHCQGSDARNNERERTRMDRHPLCKTRASEQWHRHRVGTFLHGSSELPRDRLRRTIHFRSCPNHRYVSFRRPFRDYDQAVRVVFRIMRQRDPILSARRLNFQTLYEIPYEHLHKEKNKFKVFGHCHPENYSIACMAVRVSRPQLQLPMAPSPTYEEKRANDRAKANKKRKKAKKK